QPLRQLLQIHGATKLVNLNRIASAHTHRGAQFALQVNKIAKPAGLAGRIASGLAGCRISPVQISTRVSLAVDSPVHRIRSASETCRLAIRDVMDPKTPAVSQVGCAPPGG